LQIRPNRIDIGSAKSMTILIEAISVVVRLDALDRLGVDGRDAFFNLIPNQTYYEDKKIGRVGFMEEHDALDFINNLSSIGLCQSDDSGAYMDFAILLQEQEEIKPCPWIERFEIEWENKLLDVAAFVDSCGKVWLEDDPGSFIAPVDWSPDRGIVYHVKDDALRYQKTLSTPDGGILDQYLSPTGEVTFVGRSPRWFDLPILCLIRMPVRLTLCTCALGIAVARLLDKDLHGVVSFGFVGACFGLSLCAEFAQRFKMAPRWIARMPSFIRKASP